MVEALKVIFLFKKPKGDDFRVPYIFFGIIAWVEIISFIIALIA